MLGARLGEERWRVIEEIPSWETYVNCYFTSLSTQVMGRKEGKDY